MTAIQKAKVEECNKAYAYANINVYNIAHISTMVYIYIYTQTYMWYYFKAFVNIDNEITGYFSDIRVNDKRESTIKSMYSKSRLMSRRPQRRDACKHRDSKS